MNISFFERSLCRLKVEIFKYNKATFNISKKAHLKQTEELNTALAAATTELNTKSALLEERDKQVAELTEALTTQKEQAQSLQNKSHEDERLQTVTKREVEEREAQIIEKEYQVDLANGMGRKCRKWGVQQYLCRVSLLRDCLYVVVF